MRARSIIASRLHPEFLPTNPLRCCKLFLQLGGDARTLRKIKGFNTEGTEITETDSEETRLKREVLGQSKEFSDSSECDGSCRVSSICSQSFIISFRRVRWSWISAATRIDSWALLKFASSSSLAAISASQRAISSSNSSRRFRILRRRMGLRNRALRSGNRSSARFLPPTPRGASASCEGEWD